tara:strand:+ start:1137 stop:1298 length:162 start_codon:yes stop_codon:yes gene_type:complete
MTHLNYTVNFDKEGCVERAVDKWVLEWCRKYHPEAFVEAEKFVKKLTEETQKE